MFRIQTGCITENRASERVMQKCSMIKEAERKQYVWHDGRMKDRAEYRLLKDEWGGKGASPKKIHKDGKDELT
ncbi:MAG: GNAT family N-acetyltransferase [Clostridiales bacterium]|nr:GNAT family N-acetyltransferase [Clostridiales bacterium]